MWIFLNNAFLSIVDTDGDGTTLLVRARRRGDIERIFPSVEVRETPGRDYRFRAQIGREQVAETMAEAARCIRYPNFKNSVAEHLRHEAYARVWSVMHHYQQENGS